jgi:hypothetical protein
MDLLYFHIHMSDLPTDHQLPNQVHDSLMIVAVLAYSMALKPSKNLCTICDMHVLSVKDLLLDSMIHGFVTCGW